MAEYVKDSDGDVWESDGHGEWTHDDYGTKNWTRLAELYGPLVPCNADGEPASPAPDARALLADAFDDLAGRMSDFPPFSFAQSVPDAVTSQVAGWVGSWATETAAGLRS